MNILEKLYIIVGIVIGIALILGIFAIVYYIIKTVYLDIKDAKHYKEYFRNIYDDICEQKIKKVKDEYDRSLKSKSEEYFRKFYEEDKKKRLEEENQNGN